MTRRIAEELTLRPDTARGTLLPFDSQTPRPPRPLRPPRRAECPDIEAKSSLDVRTLSSMSGHSRVCKAHLKCPDIVFGVPKSGHWNGTSSTSSCPDIVEGVCSMSGHLGQMSVFTSHCICSISASMSGHYEVDEVRSGRSGPFSSTRRITRVAGAVALRL